MSELRAFAESISGFYKKSTVDQLLLIAWFLEVRESRSNFDGVIIKQCFRDVGLDPPDTSVYLPRLAAKKPPQLLKIKGGYKIAGSLRREFDSKYSNDPTTVAVSKILSTLPDKIPNLVERAFLTEALNCYRVKAYRAAIVMVWNLTYDHMARWILADVTRLGALNSGIATRYPKKNVTISKFDDFEEFKESEILESCRTGGVLGKNLSTIMKDKLTKRNLAAHPSQILITQHQADDAISDLVLNVILNMT